ncbi:hypothetical protein [Raoultella ornithinolytica]|uniref:hypothetical protein n=1 Tax=Raoultella ornithinolytica TaxID=54291 RepID=UPI0013F4B51E|nr:hypothetical protein [Raoultella ornithinolytica]QIJ48862.1 hypothetical protein G7Z36_11940 [Raoultella ornithinolytica]
MDFRLTKMKVMNLNFTEQDQGDSKSDSHLQIDAALEASNSNPLFARMVITTLLQSPGRYELSATLAFIFKFEEEISHDEIQRKLAEADTERMLYPYINTFLTNFIINAGYPRPGIPLILK